MSVHERAVAVVWRVRLNRLVVALVEDDVAVTRKHAKQEA